LLKPLLHNKLNRAEAEKILATEKFNRLVISFYRYVEIENAKELVGKDLNKHIKHLEEKMNMFASKLEFEDAARIRDEINRLKAKEVGLSDKILKFKKK